MVLPRPRLLQLLYAAAAAAAVLVPSKNGLRGTGILTLHPPAFFIGKEAVAGKTDTGYPGIRTWVRR